MSSPLGTPRLLGALVLASLSAGAFATGRTLTDADYARAEQFVNYRAIPLVDHAVTKVKWLDDTHFVYVDHDAQGDRYLRMDSATGHAEPLFDQAKLAAALGQPKAVRAVAAACAANKLALLVPCHRIVRQDGDLAGYRWGIERKRALLAAEGTATADAAE